MSPDDEYIRQLEKDLEWMTASRDKHAVWAADRKKALQDSWDERSLLQSKLVDTQRRLADTEHVASTRSKQILILLAIVNGQTTREEGLLIFANLQAQMEPEEGWNSL